MTPYVSVCRIDRMSEGKEPARTLWKEAWIVIVVAHLNVNTAVNFMLISPIDVKRDSRS